MAAVLPDVTAHAVTISEAMYRVHRWWRSTREGLHLGFASRSVLGRVIEEGCQGAAHDGGARPGTWMAPADEEIDRLVARMPPELRDVLVLDQKRTPFKVMACKCHCTPTEASRRKENAYGFVAGALTALQLVRTPKGR